MFIFISSEVFSKDNKDLIEVGSCIKFGRITNSDFKGYFTKSINDTKLDLKEDIILISKIDNIDIKCYEGDSKITPFSEVNKNVIFDIKADISFIKGAGYDDAKDKAPKEEKLKLVFIDPSSKVMSTYEFVVKVPVFNKEGPQVISIKEAIKGTKKVNVPGGLTLKEYSGVLFFNLSPKMYEFNQKLFNKEYKFLSVNKRQLQL